MPQNRHLLVVLWLVATSDAVPGFMWSLFNHISRVKCAEMGWVVAVGRWVSGGWWGAFHEPGLEQLPSAGCKANETAMVVMTCSWFNTSRWLNEFVRKSIWPKYCFGFDYITSRFSLRIRLMLKPTYCGETSSTSNLCGPWLPTSQAH